MPLRIGVLGAGFAGAMHAHSTLGLDDVRVVAVAAATPEEAAPLAKECGARVIEPERAVCMHRSRETRAEDADPQRHVRRLARNERGRSSRSALFACGRTSVYLVV